MKNKGFIPVIVIIIGVLVVASATLGLIYKDKITAAVINFFKTPEVKPGISLNLDDIQKAEILAEESKTVTASDQQVKTQTGCLSGSTLCNGKCWLNCEAGYQFYCSSAKGEICCKTGDTYCNSVCYNPCKAGETSYCPVDGGMAQCVPEGCVPGSFSCNGKCFPKCNTGEIFVCPADGKDGYCEIPVKTK